MKHFQACCTKFAGQGSHFATSETAALDLTGVLVFPTQFICLALAVHVLCLCARVSQTTGDVSVVRLVALPTPVSVCTLSLREEETFVFPLLGVTCGLD